MLPDDDEILDRLHLHFDISTEADGACLVPIPISVKSQGDEIEAKQAESVSDPCVLAFASPSNSRLASVETAPKQTRSLSPTLEPSDLVPPFYDSHQHNYSPRETHILRRRTRLPILTFDSMSQGKNVSPPAQDPTRKEYPRDSPVTPGLMSGEHGSISVGIKEGDYTLLTHSYRCLIIFF